MGYYHIRRFAGFFVATQYKKSSKARRIKPEELIPIESPKEVLMPETMNTGGLIQLLDEQHPLVEENGRKANGFIEHNYWWYTSPDGDITKDFVLLVQFYQIPKFHRFPKKKKL